MEEALRKRYKIQRGWREIYTPCTQWFTSVLFYGTPNRYSIGQVGKTMRKSDIGGFIWVDDILSSQTVIGRRENDADITK